jgi:hypothetical protein
MEVKDFFFLFHTIFFPGCIAENQQKKKIGVELGGQKAGFASSPPFFSFFF